MRNGRADTRPLRANYPERLQDAQTILPRGPDVRRGGHLM
jgi:hypothetical protein